MATTSQISALTRRLPKTRMSDIISAQAAYLPQLYAAKESRDATKKGLELEERGIEAGLKSTADIIGSNEALSAERNALDRILAGEGNALTLSLAEKTAAQNKTLAEQAAEQNRKQNAIANTISGLGIGTQVATNWDKIGNILGFGGPAAASTNIAGTAGTAAGSYAAPFADLAAGAGGLTAAEANSAALWGFGGTGSTGAAGGAAAEGAAAGGAGALGAAGLAIPLVLGPIIGDWLSGDRAPLVSREEFLKINPEMTDYFKNKVPWQDRDKSKDPFDYST